MREAKAVHLILFFLVAIIPAALWSQTVNVLLSPTSASVSVGQTLQFTAKVTPMSRSAVTWSVNGVPGGNTTVGVISNSGLYTAPAVPPSPAAVIVTATSVVNPAISAQATVNIVGGNSVTIS